MLVARSAGMEQARRGVAVRRIETPTKVCGPGRRDIHEEVAHQVSDGEGANKAGHESACDQSRALFADHHEHLIASCSKRHADADFGRAATHAVRHHAVDAAAREPRNPSAPAMTVSAPKPRAGVKITLNVKPGSVSNIRLPNRASRHAFSIEVRMRTPRVRFFTWLALPSSRFAAQRASLASTPATRFLIGALRKVERRFVVEIAIEFPPRPQRSDTEPHAWQGLPHGSTLPHRLFVSQRDQRVDVRGATRGH